MSKDWVNPNPTGNELDTKLKAAGIGRSTFFKRRKAGATIEQALTGPETTGPGKSEMTPEYKRQVQTALRFGLIKSEAEVPSIKHYLRNKERGLSPRIAILARTRWTYQSLQSLQDEVAQRNVDCNEPVSTLYRSYLTSLYEQANCLTPEQFYTIALMLTRVIETNDNSRGKSAKKG